jgi:hypothetical protein
VSRKRCVFVVGGSGAADDERARGERGHREGGNGSDHQPAHDASPSVPS